MSRFRNKLVAVCLLAIWLVATQHCGLEAAGVFSGHDEEAAGCCTTSGGCATDDCATVEEGAYRPDGAPTAISAPQLAVCIFLTRARVTAPPEGTGAGISIRDRFGRAWEWVATWQFVQRAALSPRAPSLTAA